MGPCRRTFPAIAALVAAMTSSHALVLAGDENWVRYHLGVQATQESTERIAVHPSGETTVVGRSSGQILILRFGVDGEERWSRFEPIQGYLVGPVLAVASGEDLYVAASYVFYESNSPLPITWGTVFKVDAAGARVWSQVTAAASDAVADGGGGVLLAGNHSPPPDDPICPPCGAHLTRFDQDGRRIWNTFQVPDSLEHRSSTGSGPLAADAAGNAYLASEFVDFYENVPKVLLTKHTSEGQLVWFATFLPGMTRALPSDLALVADGSSTVVGTRSGEIWTARHDPDGQELWIQSRPALDSPASVAVSPDGVSYVASAIGSELTNADILLSAYDPGGDLRWERTYDSGSSDTPAAIALAPDGTIAILGTAGERIVLLRYGEQGDLILTSRYEAAPAQAAALGIHAGGRLIAAGTTLSEDHDLLALEFEESGGFRLLARCCGVATAEHSSPAAVHVAPDGGVTTAFGSHYGPQALPTFDLVRYRADGSEAWLQVEPQLDLVGVGFDDSGAAVAAGVRGGNIQALRVDSQGLTVWTRDFGRESRPLTGVLVAPDGGLILVTTDETGTGLIAVSPAGHQRWWRIDPEIHYAVGQTLGPDQRIYIHRAGVPRIDCFSPSGIHEWSERYPSPAGLVLQAMEAATDPGYLYAGGSSTAPGGARWTVLRIEPGGAIAWLAFNDAAPGRTSAATLLLPYADGGVIAAGREGDAVDADVVVIRYAPGGEVLWRDGVATDHVEVPYDLAVDRQGHVLLLIRDETARETLTLDYSPDGERMRTLVFPDGEQSIDSRLITTGSDLSIAVAGGSLLGPGFTLKYLQATPVEITRLTAERAGEDVLVSWMIGEGLSPAGFHVQHASSPEGVYQDLTTAGLSSDARSFVHRSASSGEGYYLLDVIEPDGGTVRHGPVPVTAAAPPVTLWMSAPRPNPAAGPVEWEVGLPVASRVRLVVHDVTGRAVANVLDRTLPAGEHRIPWDSRLTNGGPAAPGVYFYRLEAYTETRVGKLVLGSPR